MSGLLHSYNMSYMHLLTLSFITKALSNQIILKESLGLFTSSRLSFIKNSLILLCMQTHTYICFLRIHYKNASSRCRKLHIKWKQIEFWKIALMQYPRYMHENLSFSVDNQEVERAHNNILQLREVFDRKGWQKF